MANETHDTGPITLINVFEISPDDVDMFLQEWQERAEFMGRQPGFRSLRLHRALSADSRFQLVNVAEWDSAQALQAAAAQDVFQHVQLLDAIGAGLVGREDEAALTVLALRGLQGV